MNNVTTVWIIKETYGSAAFRDKFYLTEDKAKSKIEELLQDPYYSMCDFYVEPLELED